MIDVIQFVFAIDDRTNRHLTKITQQIFKMNRAQKSNLDILENAFASIIFNLIFNFEHVFINFD